MHSSEQLLQVATLEEAEVIRVLRLRRLRATAGYGRCEVEARRSILDGRARFAEEEQIVQKEFGTTIGQLFKELL